MNRTQMSKQITEVPMNCGSKKKMAKGGMVKKAKGGMVKGYRAGGAVMSGRKPKKCKMS